MSGKCLQDAATPPSLGAVTVSSLRRLLPLVVCWGYAALLTGFSLQIMNDIRPGNDSHAYWRAARGAWDASTYAISPGYVDAYNYSPAFVQAIWPIAQLPWPAFGTLWSVAACAAFVWLLWPLGVRYVIPLVLCCSPEILSGNVFWLLALAAVASARPGARHHGAAAWAFVVLTKVTPALGPLWHALRREWRSLAWSVAATAGVVAVSVLVSPGLWAEWISFLARNERSTETVGSPILGPVFGPIVVRLPLALVLLAWGALTDRRWALPLAMAIVTPVAGPAAFTMLAAIPRLRQSGDSTSQQVQPDGQSTSDSPSIVSMSASGAVPTRVTTRSTSSIP